MQGSYRDTLRLVQAMVDDPFLTSLPEASSQPCGNGSTVLAAREGDLEKLRKLNLQAASQIDKLDKKAKKTALIAKRDTHQQMMLE